MLRGPLLAVDLGFEPSRALADGGRVGVLVPQVEGDSKGAQAHPNAVSERFAIRLPYRDQCRPASSWPIGGEHG
jgi:hypothetical protein